MMGVRVDLDGRVVVLVCEGEYSPQDLKDAWGDVEARPNYPSAPLMCLDLRTSASVARRSTAELRALADWFADRASRVGNRCALVARPGLQWGLMRMASAWVDLRGVHAHVLTTREHAVAWLVEHEPRSLGRST
jgi:hypothetical protein